MGDAPAQQHGEYPTAAAQNDENVRTHTAAAHEPTSSTTPFYSQFNSLQQAQARSDVRSAAHHPSTQYAPGEFGGPSPLNMGAMAGALPEYASTEAAMGTSSTQQHGQRQSLSGASTSALVYQLQQNLQIPGPASAAYSAQQSYDPSYGSAPSQQSFVPAHSSQQVGYPAYSAGPHRSQPQLPMQPNFQHFPQQSSYMYYPQTYGQQAPYQAGFPVVSATGAGMYGRRPSLPMTGHGLDPGVQEGHYMGGRMNMAASQADLGSAGLLYGASSSQAPAFQRSGPASSIPRGPPRKPKQSGHALWVGNLPPGTTVMALKDHFSREATKDIESLFLISKSNCAFVNYRTEESCTAAMHRFHDSRFNGVRLVCRLRRSSAPASGVPTGPSAMVGAQPTSTSPPRSPQIAADNTLLVDGEAPARKSSEDGRATAVSADRYFIVKSLTLQDLELSVRNGTWATQSHNEDNLNRAFEAAKNVFLIFSANKSGEYFGYARMSSPILHNATEPSTLAPKPGHAPEAVDVPRSIPTPATEHAPKGRIIDDSARGTIFWEAELSDSEGVEDPTGGGDAPAEEDLSGSTQGWGKPFKIEWISTTRLPFYRTRGLRNPWNANREVKIARDGTELEPAVGERLVQMFHRLGPPSAGPGAHQLLSY